MVETNRRRLGIEGVVNAVTNANQLVRELNMRLENTSAFIFGVARGMLSEGTDFAGNLARGAIVLGVPYPYLGDPKVHLKRHDVGGSDWYDQEAMQAVNQALGRVIRSQEDYGFVLLVDSRYGWNNYASLLPRWVQEHLRREWDGS